MTRKFEVENGAEPKPLEIKTANFLVSHGHQVLFLKPINQIGVRTPDILLDNEKYELKSPVSNRPRTINKRFREALMQSPRIIFDLRNIKGDTRNLEKLLAKWFMATKCKKLVLITKEQKTIDFIKKI
jgi:hypothetical protein